MVTDIYWRRSLLSWVSMGTLLVLCAVLGGLQYRWVGELSLAERHRLKSGLQASLNRLSKDFNSEISTACAALIPSRPTVTENLREEEYTTRYLQWRDSSQQEKVFRSIARAVPHGEDLVLRRMNLATGQFTTVEWPDSWKPMRARLFSMASQAGSNVPGPPGPPVEEMGMLLDVPRFVQTDAGGPGRAPVSQVAEWLVFEMEPSYLRNELIPELLRRHLGVEGSREFQVEVLTRTKPVATVFTSEVESAQPIGNAADASANLMELQYDRILRRTVRDANKYRSAAPSWGRWVLSARHHAGSLEAVVSRARWRNLSVMGGILLLMLATVIALIRFTERAQKLAELQMAFVAGVSHELRTPLTVIHTAAYNLRGRVAQDPARVARYGSLIQQESERLRELVERVLRFAAAQAGQVIREREPVRMEDIINESLEASASVLDSVHCQVEKSVEPDLPLVLGDAVALKHVLINLISNAAKYGCEGNNWIGICAIPSGGVDRAYVEVRVSDHGPGIPLEEQPHVFEPFYRGRRAIQAQSHGTGLGLSLVKGIVEAHKGSIELVSEPGKGSVFTVRIPTAPVAQQDECKSLTN